MYHCRTWRSCGRRTCREAGRPEQRDRLLDPTAIGERSRHDEAPLGEDVAACPRPAQLGPDLGDAIMTAEGAFAVGEHRVLVERTGQVGERP